MSIGLLGAVAQATAMAVVVSLLLLFAGIGALVLMHVCVVGRVFREGLMVIARGQGCGGVGAGLPPEELEELPCYDYRAGEEGGGSADCAVCLEAFQGGDRCRRLPLCGHGFHAQCVDSWLLRSAACPICRRSADPRKSPTAAGGERERSEVR